MKKIIAVLLILVLCLVVISGCSISKNDSEIIPLPPRLLEDSTQNQQKTGEIPSPPALPEE